MKTILRNSITGLFFQGLANWTEHLDQAFDFQRPERLVRFVRAADLRPDEVELVFAFDDPRYNLTLAIDERFGVNRPSRNKRREAPAEAKQELFANASHGLSPSSHGVPGIAPKPNGLQCA